LYPSWKGYLKLTLEEPTLLEYKYIVVAKRNDNREKLIRWETLETIKMNRRVYVRPTISCLNILDAEGDSQHVSIEEKLHEKSHEDQLRFTNQ
jgi:hypothetical protein